MCGDDVYGWYGRGIMAYPTQPTMGYSYSGIYRQTETKKQRIARIAKELMYASWKIFNQKTVSIIKIIQIRKPRHQLKFCHS